MNNDLIQLPEVSEIKELITCAREDIDNAAKEDAELASQSQLVLEVLRIIEEQISKQKDLNKLNLREKISVAANLNFLHGLLEDFFFDEEDFEEFEEMDYEDEESLDEK